MITPAIRFVKQLDDGGRPQSVSQQAQGGAGIIEKHATSKGEDAVNPEAELPFDNGNCYKR